MQLMTLKNKGQFLLLVLFILTLAITLTINAYPLYSWDISYLSIEDKTGLSKERLLINYHELMKYLNHPLINELKMSDFPVSESGAFHFYEVKRLFLINYVLMFITGIPAVSFVSSLWKSGRLWLIKHALAFTALVPIILVFFLLVAFDQVFVAFHHLMFNNDAWLFDPQTDPVIIALPEQYFLHCFTLAVLLFEGFVLFLLIKSKQQLKKLRT
ncbi:TIGR01906 family membrane protein [Vagococcus xieshaowenii]|uniref:TIGR01906 family membrane protein n=1 Tax=Vagococcus xieshaowenii TaxID=2562451 RepID=A0AAJ5EEJ0_9ENTE|nr:TIGR01906 family membrane protein [Vagococcus xieshaowenii]QCA29003.1 TIGR01906 family membrane protein [Vagococcus xieshaowenii]TFZ41022.1 TIGR01906 family membrane protein [Vagococcus xieshaowenii]